MAKNRSAKKPGAHDSPAMADLRRAADEHRGADAVRILSRLHPEALDEQGQSLAARALALRALQNYAAGTSINAIIADLSLACRYRPNDPRLHFHLGLAYLKAELHSKALRSLRAALALDPANRRYLYHACWAAAVSGHQETAAWLDRLKAAGEDISLLKGLGASAETAPAEIDQAGDGPAARITLGNRQLADGKFDQALGCFEAALRAGVETPELCAAIDRLQAHRVWRSIQGGDHDSAVSATDLLGSDPTWLERAAPRLAAAICGITALGEAKGGRYLPAMQFWKRVIEIGDPAQARAAMHNIAIAATRMEDFETAAVYWRRWLDSAGPVALEEDLQVEAWRRLSDCYEKAKKFDRADEALRAVLRLRPEDRKACEDLIECLTASDRWAEALEHLERLRNSQPESSTLWTRIGKAKIETADFDGAEEAFRQALQLEPGNPTARRAMLGRLRHKLNALRQKDYAVRGLKMIQEAIEAMPGYSSPQIVLAEYFFNLGDNKRGNSTIDRILAAAPADAEVWEEALGIYLHMGLSGRARRLSERMLNQFKGKAGTLVYTGEMLLEHGLTAPAEKHFDAALQASGDPDIAIDIAECYEDVGDFDMAERFFAIAKERRQRQGDA